MIIKLCDITFVYLCPRLLSVFSFGLSHPILNSVFCMIVYFCIFHLYIMCIHENLELRTAQSAFLDNLM